MKHTREEEEEQEEDPVTLKRVAVENALAVFTSAARDLHETLVAKQDELATAQRDLRKAQAALDAIDDRTLVHFNVCGTPVTLTAETLKRRPCTYFGAYLSGRWTVNAKPEFFETAPDTFAHIVRYLLCANDDDFNLASVPEASRADLKVAAERFVLSDLAKKLQGPAPLPEAAWVISYHDSACVLDKGMRIVYPKARAGEVCAMGNMCWTAGVHEWIVTDCGSTNVMIGVAVHGIEPTSRSSNWNRIKCIYPRMGVKAKPDGSTGSACFDKPGTIMEHSTFMMRLDMNAHTLTVGINGVWNVAPTFTDLTNAQPIYPYFDLYAVTNKLTLVSRRDY